MKKKVFKTCISKDSKPVDTIPGSPNEEKLNKRTIKRMKRGNTYTDRTKVAGAFGNKPNLTIPVGYDFTFPKKEKHGQRQEEP